MADTDDLLRQRRDSIDQSPGATPPPQPFKDSGLPPSVEFGDVGNASLSFDERLRARQKQLESGTNAPDPIALDLRERNRFAAQQVDQPFLGPPGMEELGPRTSIGFQDTFPEQKAAFEKNFPEGDFREVNLPDGSKVVLFRRNQKEDFRKLDAEALEKFEPLGDLADIVSAAPSVLAESVFLRGAATIGKQMLQVVLGNVTGEAAKETIQKLQGTQRETFGEMGGRAAVTAAGAAVGAAGTTVISGPLNAFRGRSNLPILPGAPQAMRAGKRLEAPPLLPSQIARSPLIQRLGQLSAATVKTVGDYVREQHNASVRALFRLRAQDVTKYVNRELKGIHDDATKQIINAVTDRQVTLQRGGNAVAHGVAEYDDLATTLVNTAYADARKVATPEFEVTPAQQMAEEILQGRPSATVEGGTQRLNEVSTGLQREAEKLLNIDPNLPDVQVGERIVTGTDQLRQIRSNLWDLKTPRKGEIARDQEKQAGRLFAAVDFVLKNPKNADDRFIGAWRAANELASDRFSTMEKIIVARAGRDETPAKLAASFVKPNEVDNILVMRDVLPADRFLELRQAALTDFISPQNIRRLPQRFDSFDEPTLDALFTKQQQDALREAAEGVRRLNASRLQETIELKDRAIDAITDVVENNDGNAARVILENIGPRDGQRSRAIRAGLIEMVVDRSITVDRGVRSFNKAGFTKTLTELNKKGFLAALTVGDKKLLANLRNYVDFLPVSADPGVSIAATETAAGVRGLERTAIITLLENVGTGRLFTSKFFQRAVAGSGQPSKPFRNLRLVGAVLGGVAAEEAQQ